MIREVGVGGTGGSSGLFEDRGGTGSQWVTFGKTSIFFFHRSRASLFTLQSPKEGLRLDDARILLNLEVIRANGKMGSLSFSEKKCLKDLVSSGQD